MTPADTTDPRPVDVVYCGGCNPEIDRGAIAREIEPAGGDKTVLLSGCARACASDHQLVDETAGIIVAGRLVDGVPTAPADIPAAIARRLEE